MESYEDDRRRALNANQVSGHGGTVSHEKPGNVVGIEASVHDHSLRVDNRLADPPRTSRRRRPGPAGIGCTPSKPPATVQTYDTPGEFCKARTRPSGESGEAAPGKFDVTPESDLGGN